MLKSDRPQKKTEQNNHPAGPPARPPMKIATISLLLISAGAMCAVDVVTTNWLTAHPSFREVNGQLYNVDRSIKFLPFSGRCLEVLTNGIVLREITIKTNYARSRGDRLSRYGNFLGSSGPASLIKTGEEEIEGDKIIIINYPGSPTTDSHEDGMAMRIKRIQHRGETLWLYDYGLPHIVPVLVTNKVAL